MVGHFVTNGSKFKGVSVVDR